MLHRRCIIPARGFYEWDRSRTKFSYERKDAPVLFMAGCYDPVSYTHLPFFHSLQENTVRGNLYVSCYGGNTCDTEFESLTGNSILYAPNTPFETQFHGPMPSIVSTLKDDGYEAIAMHPLGAADWNRDDVYLSLIHI